ncbi:MAG: phage tail tape measure protein [Turicibacter sp.]|nr:phage tail tape measure protein [Turicibacter sp.]
MGEIERGIRYAGLKLQIDGAAEFERTLGSINRELKLSQEELKKVTNEYGRNERNIETLTARKEQLETAVRLNVEQQKKLREMLANVVEEYGANSKEAETFAIQIAKAEAESVLLNRQLRETTEDLRRQQEALNPSRWEQFSQQLAEISEKMQNMGERLTDIGETITDRVSAPLINFGKSAVETFIQFDDRMRSVAATMGTTAEETDRLTTVAREMAAATQFSATEAADALYYMALAGWDVNQAIDALPGLLGLAAASGTNLGTAADIVTDGLTAMGYAASDAGRFADVLAAAASNSNTNVEMMGQAFKYAAPLAGTFGFSMEDLALTTGLMADSGIKASQAGTTMRNLFLEMATPMEIIVDGMTVAAVETENLDGSMRDLRPILEELRHEFAGLTDSQKMQAAEALVGKSAISGFLAVINASDEDFYALAYAIDTSTDSAQAMADTMQAGLGGQIGLMKSALEETSLVIGTALAPMLIELTQLVTGIITKFNELDDGTQAVIIGVGLFAAALGPVVTAIGGFIQNVGIIAGAFGKLSANLAMQGGVLTVLKGAWAKFTAVLMMNPFVAIAVAIAALAVGIGVLISNMRKNNEEAQALNSETEQLAARHEALTAAMERGADAFLENSQAMEDNKTHALGLLDSISELAERGNLTGSEMFELTRTIDELNNIIPGLSLGYDAVTGSLIDLANGQEVSNEQLQQYIELAMEQQKMDAAMEETFRLRMEQIELERELAEVTARRAEVEAETFGIGDWINGTRKASNELLAELTAAEETYRAALDANIETQEALGEAIEASVAILEEFELGQTSVAESLEGVSLLLYEQGLDFADWEQMQADALDKISNSFENYKQITTNMFDTVKERASISIEEMTENLRANAAAVEEWSENMRILVERGVDQGIIDQLKAGGVEAAASVRELVNASDEELAELETAFRDSTAAAMAATRNELDPAGMSESFSELIDQVATSILENNAISDSLIDTLADAYESMNEKVEEIGFDEVGENIVDGAIQGIDNRMGDLQEKSEEMAEDGVLNPLTETFVMNSPSKKTMEIGEFVGEGLIEGMENTKSNIIDTATQLATAIITAINDKINSGVFEVQQSIRNLVQGVRSTAESEVNSANFATIGENMASGVARGIDSGGGLVQNAARNLINKAMSAMKSAADIRSPSRKTMEFGEFLGEGLKIGLDSYLQPLEESAKDITKSMLNVLNFTADPNLGELTLNVAAADVGANSVRPQHSQENGRSETAPTEISITGNNFYIREEADIDKIATKIWQKTNRNLAQARRIGGAFA